MSNPDSDLTGSSFAGGHDVSEQDLDRLLSDYLIITESRRDPFGTVFRARQLKTQQGVSIRILVQPAIEFPGGESSFAQYAASYAQIHHPTLAGITDYGVTDAGHLYLVTRPAENELETVSGLGPERIRDVYIGAIAAVEYLHHQGMAHGYLVPSQISFEDPGIVTVDGLGLAGLANSLGPRFDSSPTSPYLAPELAGLAEATIQSDLYMLGACLYHTLTGKLPRGMFDLPSELEPGLDPAWDTLVASALKPSSEKRLESAAAFRTLLEQTAVDTRPESARSPTPPAAPPARRLQLQTGSSPKTSSPQPSTPSPRSASVPPGRQSPFPWGLLATFVLVVVFGTGLVFYLKRDRTDDPTEELIAQDESTPDPTHEGNESDEENRPAREPEIDRQARIFHLLTDLRSLAPHCPNLAAAVDRDQMLKTLVLSVEALDAYFVASENREMVERLLSDELAESLGELVESARLANPKRPRRAGTLIAWGPRPGSERRAAEILPDFRGPEEGIISLAGTPEVGLALTHEGTIAHWGMEGSAVPEMKDIVAIDCEQGTCVALSARGTVFAWGNGLSPGKAAASWDSVARVSAGAGYVIAVTEAFELLYTGREAPSESTMPKAVAEAKVIDAEGVGDRIYAVSANGTVFHWGGHQPSVVQTIFAPHDIRSSGTNLYIQSLTGEILKYDRYGNRSEEDFGSETADIFIPRFSPDESIFAYTHGSSRWTLRNESGLEIDAPYWQKTSRGAVDLLLGEDLFLGAAPRVTKPGETEPAEPGATPEDPSIPLVEVEGIRIPEFAAYRTWTPLEGVPRRARLLDRSEDGNIVLAFEDGSEATVPDSRFVEEDRNFVKRWEPATRIEEKRIQHSLSHLSPEQFLDDFGYERLDLQLRDGDPVAKVTINGEATDLIIDTGATRTMLVTRLADRAAVPLRDRTRVLTWQGRVPAYTGRADRVGLGGAEFRDVDILAVDLDEKSLGSGGLLGLDLMRNARSALDFGRSQLLIRKPGEMRAQIDFPTRLRNWRGDGSEAIRARLVSEDGELLELETAGGNTETIPKSELVQADREYLEAWKLHSRFLLELAKRKSELELGDVFSRDRAHWSELPVSIQNNTQVIKLRLDGHDLEFFVDTGAPHTMLSIQAARELGHNINTMEVIGAAGGIEGRRVPVFAAEFASLQVGAQLLHDYRMHVYDFENMTDNRLSGTPFDGVVGTDLLTRLRAIIDMDRNRILLPRD